MPLLATLQRARPKVYYQGGGALGTSLQAVAHWQEAIRPGSWSSVWSDDFPWHYVTEEETLDLPVVAGFMSITQSLLLQMPLNAFRTQPDGTQALIQPTPPILVNPSPAPGRTFVDFITEYIHSMFLYGNYVAVLGPKNAAGWPEMMVPIPVGQWNVNADNGRRWYEVNGMTFSPDQIFHVMMNKASGDLMGKGALQL